jgi:dienelactone hydrolase
MRIGRVVAFVVVLVAFASPAVAALRSRVVDYSQDGHTLQGYMAWDDANKARRPGVLVVHEWWGHNENARRAADRLAKAGYVAFALDMFGKGRLAAHPDSAQAFVAEATRDVDVAVARFNAALDQLKAHEHVDAARIGAIGYCFGGAVVLSMARSGADLRAVGTFHAALVAGKPTEPGRVKAKLLVQTGGADAMVPAEAVAAFEKDMTAAGVTYRVIRYPGAKHSFTSPDAGRHGMDGLQYDAAADRKSWAELIRFFRKEL